MQFRIIFLLLALIINTKVTKTDTSFLHLFYVKSTWKYSNLFSYNSNILF